MAKKTIDSKMWKDNFFCELTPKQKLLWIYLITNDSNTMLGIYEFNIRLCGFDTGLTNDEILSFLELFSSKGKIIYKSDYITLCNFLKHQNYNINMKKSALTTYINLPNELKIKDEDYFDEFDDMAKAFGFAHKEIKVKPIKTQNTLFNQFWTSYNKSGKREEALAEFNLFTKQEQAQILKSVPKYINSLNDKKFQKLAINFLLERVFDNFKPTLSRFDEAERLLVEYDVIGNKQTYKGQDYHYPENTEYAKEIQELERKVMEGWGMSVKELYNKVNE